MCFPLQLKLYDTSKECVVQGTDPHNAQRTMHGFFFYEAMFIAYMKLAVQWSSQKYLSPAK